MEKAEEVYPDGEFIHGDMRAILSTVDQEEYDVIVAIASIQHLPTMEDRQIVWHEMHRILKYDGTLFAVNWSLSDWFLKKYWKNIVASVLYTIFSVGHHDWRDIQVPWSS